MKHIVAYVRENKLEGVVDALERLPHMTGVVVVGVRAYGHLRGSGEVMEVQVAKVEVDVPDFQLDTVVDCIVENARTGRGHAGDGKVLVFPLDRVVRVDTGARVADEAG